MNTRTVCCIALLTATPACALLEFDLEDQIPETTITGVPIPNVPLPAANFLPPLSMDIDIDQEASARDISVEAVSLKSLTLAITNTAKASASDEDSFDFLDVLNIYIEGASGSTLPRVKIAWADPAPVPTGTTSLTLTVDDSVNLLPYLQEGHTLRCEIAGFPPGDDVSYDGTIVVHVVPF